MEKIIKIEQVHDLKLDPSKWQSYEGFKIHTNEQEILVLIEDDQHCCEDAGYLSSFEDPKDFEDSDLLKIEIVDESLNKKEWHSKFQNGLDEGRAIFINFETSKGLFQLTVYNSHNGYYGHDVIIKSNQVNEETSL